MNLLYVSGDPRLALGAAAGHATHMRRTIGAFEAEGHVVRPLIAGDREGAHRAKRRFSSLKGRLPRALTTSLRDLHMIVHERRFAADCLRRCRELGADFIYERATPYQMPGRRLADALGIPLVLEINSPLEELIMFHGCSRWMIALASRRETQNAVSADAVIVGSQGMRDYLVARGVDGERITVVYPTAGDEFFEAADGGPRVRDELGLAPFTVVGFVGTMAPFHRVDVLLRAAREALRHDPQLRFLVVGAGPGYAAAMALAGNLQIADKVIFTGRVDHHRVPDYCAAMDICVIPNATWYGSPTKLFEYAAAGKPIIAPAAGPIEELIRDGESGLLIPPADAGALADKIGVLAADTALRRRLGSALQRQVADEHTWAKNARRILDSLSKHTEAPGAAAATTRR